MDRHLRYGLSNRPNHYPVAKLQAYLPTVCSAQDTEPSYLPCTEITYRCYIIIYTYIQAHTHVCETEFGCAWAGVN